MLNANSLSLPFNLASLTTLSVIVVPDLIKSSLLNVKISFVTFLPIKKLLFIFGWFEMLEIEIFVCFVFFRGDSLEVLIMQFSQLKITNSFVNNSSKLNNPDNQKKTIQEMGIKNGSKVTIIDVKDIIGA